MFFGGFPGFGGGGFGKENANAQVDNQEFYDILGVKQDATADEIRKAYRQKVVKVHPDKKGGNAEEFKKLQAAYEVISDPEKRELYDQYGIDGIRDDAGGVDPFEGLFGGLFGGKARSGRNAQPQKLKPIVKKISVKLEEIYAGGMKKVTFTRQRTCKTCDGQGGKDPKKCEPCRGTGMVEKVVQIGPGMLSSSRSACKDCKGEGVTFEKNQRCGVCKGEKIKSEEKTLEVPIELGAPSNHHVSFSGEGNEYPGTLAGDVIIQFELEPHKRFERKGADLYYKQKISLYEALTGTAFYIEHLDGKKLLVTTPPNDIITPNMIKEIKGKGLSFFGDAMSHGNLYVNFIVDFPKKGELKSTELLKKVLPVPKDLLTNYDKSKAQVLEDFDETKTNPNPSGGRRGRGGEDSDEEEDDDMPHGQRVQCGQQ